MEKKIAKIEVIRAGSNPDIDSDFNTNVRDSVLEHISQTYGKNNVSNIITFGTLAAKGAFKTMCTIYQVPFSEANRISNLIPKPIEGVDCTLDDVFNPNSDRYNEAADFRAAVSGEKWKKIMDGALAISGRIKSTGVHACGILISNKPLYDSIPLMTRQDDGRVISQWEYKNCEQLGLIKFDILGLDTVNLVQNTVEYIKKSGKTPPNMLKIISEDMDDEKVYKMISSGKTDGIFQLGSELVKTHIRNMKPTEFNDIAAATALYRPGPMSMDSHTKYADRKNGREKMEYPIHPDFKDSPLEEILKETYGLCIPIGTKILTENGLWIPIQDLKTTNLTPSRNLDGSYEKNRVNNVVSTGKKKIIKIRTKGNRTLRVSETHPVLTPMGYIEAKNLDIGTKIAKSNKILLDVEDARGILNPQKSYFLGAMLGDGSITGNSSPYLTNRDADFIANIENIVSTEFPNIRVSITPRKRDEKTYSNMINFVEKSSFTGKYDRNQIANAATRNSVNVFFNSIGYEGKILMYDKYISDYVMQTNNENLLHLLAGLWDTDGMAGENGISYTTTSQQLFTGIQRILIRLGIDFFVEEKSYSNRKREDRISYRIHINSSDFSRSIQPLLKISKKRDYVCKIRKYRAHNETTNILLKAVERFNERVQENPSVYSEHLGLASKRTLAENKDLGLKSLESYTKRKYGDTIVHGNEEMFKTLLQENFITLEELSYVNTIWTPVIEIVEDGYEDCYDIEVDKNHNFLVDGFVVHNCVYQEQVMKITNEIAGMSLQEGDKIRKAMGKKLVEEMNKLEQKFFDGAIANGYSKEAVEKLWETIVAFSRYGFNKSHAIAYAMSAYQTAYLKANFPVEFMAALLALNSGNKDKILTFLKVSKIMGIKVGSININLSDIKTAPDFKNKSEYDILYGISGASAVSEDIARIIVDERERNGEYKSIKDLVDRCLSLGVNNKRMYENLALSGAFDCFGVSRRGVVENINLLLSDAKDKGNKGESLFDVFEIETAEHDVNFSAFEEFSFVEKLKKEASVFGLYITKHPLSNIGIGLSQAGVSTIKALKNSNKMMTKTVVGSIVEIEKKVAKRSGNKSMTLVIDDGNESIKANLASNVVKGIDKKAAQNTILKAYEKNDTISEETIKKALQPDILAYDDVELFDVYVMDITYRPSFGDNKENYGARIEKIRKLNLDHNGKLPIRLRIKAADNEKNRAKIVNFIENIQKNNSGEYSVYTSIIENKDLYQEESDADYFTRIISLVENGDTNEEIPRRKKIKKRKTEFDISNDIEYFNTNCSLSKDKKVEILLTEKFGAERVDFGIFNNEIGDEQYG